MTRPALSPPALAPAAAFLVLCALLVCFYPRNTLAVLTGGPGVRGPQPLTVSAGGVELDYAASTEQALLSALSERPCVRLPGLPSGPCAGEIRLSFGDMWAVVSPQRAYLRSAAGGSTYVIMGSGPELYQRVQELVSLRA